MIDFDIQRCTRKCAATDRELRPGETVYSVLLAEGSAVVRRDYSADAWPGPPEGALGWWKSQLPSPQSRKLNWAPSDVMLHYFVELESRPDDADLRYVLTLLMVRRRLLRLDETVAEADGGETLVVYAAQTDTQYRVPVRQPPPERVEQIQQQLGDLLCGGAA